MRKIIVAVMSTISGLVLLFSYHTSTNSQAAEATEPTTDTGTEQSAASTPNAAEASGTAPAASKSASESPAASESSAAASGDSGTYTGAAVETHWGTVQVQITVVDGKVTKAVAVEYPNENPKDRQINAYAIPKLNVAVVAAQSAQIDAISGATVTSDGYIESLQSAIDAAHLG